MVKEKNGEFVQEYKKFYKSFFEGLADSIDHLAYIHDKYSTQYKKILDFQENPENLGQLIEGLSAEQKGILLSVLIKAGEFGRKFATLMEMHPKDKRKFAEDLRKFAKELEEIKQNDK